ncbi:BNR-4 repeat-containing protein [Roseomonas sp. CAU 1739]|uniref:BNR-4 repeat-containing protein n=1 Tax=Roseomonas sp. CAU 1739 TaxID=3140364 RepID=UPI00325B4F0B
MRASFAMLRARIAAALRPGQPAEQSPALPPRRPAAPVLMQANAAWCWFHRERALTIDGVTYFGSVAGVEERGEQAGALRLTRFDHAHATARTVTLDIIRPPDDHNVPALCRLADGRLLAAWQGHGSGGDIFHRIFDDRLEPRSPVLRTDALARVSYSNLFQLPGDDVVLNFHRGIGWGPNLLASLDGGTNFIHGGRLLHAPRPDPRDPRATGLPGGRPYLVYAQQGARIHFAAVEDHPRAYDNTIHHGYLEAGQVHDSHGRAVGAPSGGSAAPELTFTALTRVFEGAADRVPWVSDIAAFPDGRISIAFSVQVSGAAHRARTGLGGEDLRYRIAHFDGATWDTFEIAHAGPCLYAGEDDYSGLIALDPDDPARCAIATSRDPLTGTPIGGDAAGARFGIQLGTIDFAARRAAFRPLSAPTREDHLRPVFSRRLSGASGCLLWMAGEYRSYTRFATRVLGLTLPGGPPG